MIRGSGRGEVLLCSQMGEIPLNGTGFSPWQYLRNFSNTIFYTGGVYIDGISGLPVTRSAKSANSR